MKVNTKLFFLGLQEINLLFDVHQQILEKIQKEQQYESSVLTGGSVGLAVVGLKVGGAPGNSGIVNVSLTKNKQKEEEV